MRQPVRTACGAARPGVAQIAILLAFGLGSVGGAVAMPQSFNYHGTPLLSGGVSEEERDQMRGELGPYNVWLAFVERDTGNYVAGVKVSVIDDKGNALIDTVADGPWLLAQLPPGFQQHLHDFAQIRQTLHEFLDAVRTWQHGRSQP